MTTLTTSDTTTLPIYRFKFSDEFMGPLTEFSSKHRFDEAALFQDVLGPLGIATTKRISC